MLQASFDRLRAPRHNIETRYGHPEPVDCCVAGLLQTLLFVLPVFGCDKKWYLYRRGSVFHARSMSSQDCADLQAIAFPRAASLGKALTANPGSVSSEPRMIKEMRSYASDIK